MSDLQIFNCEQGTPEWFAARAGIPTASEFSTVMMKLGPRGGVPLTRQKYLYQLAGQRLTGNVEEGYTNANMERGHQQEAEARALYEMATDNVVQQVGFLRLGSMGASPDGLVGEDGAVEIKTAFAHIQIARLLQGTIPPEHVAQVQGVMMVADRQWCDFVSYCPGLPPLIVRVNRDGEFCTTMFQDIMQFNDEIESLCDRIRGL